MDRDARSARMRPRRPHAALLVAAIATLVGCAAHTGRLTYVPETVVPPTADSLTKLARAARTQEVVPEPVRALFADTTIGFMAGTGDSTRRYLGRLRAGYTADTLNVILLGDNRPGFRATRLYPEFQTIQQMVSPNPVKIVKGLVTIPIALFKGLWPDLALVRDLTERMEHMPRGSFEHPVTKAVVDKIDSIEAHGQVVAAVVNTGDLVEDGRYPAHWDRFLRIWRPVTKRVPYFPIAGNHERTDTPDGVENWRTATGLPVGGDRLYYCFDSVDGWLRIIALDTNPIVDPSGRWTREVQVKYSEEEFKWLVARVKEHTGPVIVLMHHPPFSSGMHHQEWQADSVLRERRERMVRSLHEVGISVIASGHEHAYQRALLTWPDAVLIAIVTGGAGAPLHEIPPQATAAQMYSEYKVAGAVVKPENVLVNKVFHFIHLRLWFGGGEFYTYSVDKNAKTHLIDKVQIDLKRYGVPKIDQHKMPVPPSKGPKEPSKHEGPTAVKAPAPKADSTAASERILSKPAPGKKTPLRKVPLRKTSARKEVASEQPTHDH